MRVPRLIRGLGGLRVRLIVAFTLVAVAGTLTTGALTFREARNGVLQQSQDSVLKQFRDHVNTLAPAFTLPLNQTTLDGFAADAARAGRSQGWRVLAVYGDLRATSVEGDDFAELTPSLREAATDRPVTVFQRVTKGDRSVLVMGVPVTYAPVAEGEPRRASGLVVFLSVSQRNEQAYVDALVSAVQRAVLPALGLAVVLALLAARGVLRPVRELRRAAGSMAEGRFDTRLTVHGSDELADLSQTFNETASALDRSVAELRRMEARARAFAADVSHELRTPLAAMAAVTDVLDEDARGLDPDTATAVRLISQETGKLARLVDDLMEVSRFDAGAAELRPDEIDLAESLRRTLASRGWTDTVETELPPPGGPRVLADPRRLDVVVANLVANALRHGAPPVRVRLYAAPERTGGPPARAVVEVSDRGPGIPEEVLPHVFERFYKSDSARTRTEGSGLGLAIAMENVRLHGGTLTAANRPGGGAVFTMDIPLGPVDSAPGAPVEEDLA
ncbi:sensor histidine kinase [Streptomyces paludis]|uniref:histidine kinase n=1 Tax=Streptomyces paludis TaxID=2282738 RepID=A0A345HI31_9ACTN|nr:HAMP domain-containing sensor histidine kinase [Streptomyces paludis]AXG76355.1 sensor histidine kinase [Streptomyces paludis]